MTVAPQSTANWIAAWPTAPEPPWTSSVSPGADGERAQGLVGRAGRDAERGALRGADLRGPRVRVLRRDDDIGRVGALAPKTTTASPTRKPSTSSPTAVTTPARVARRRARGVVDRAGRRAGRCAASSRWGSRRPPRRGSRSRPARERVGDLDKGQDLGSAELGVNDRISHGRAQLASVAGYSRMTVCLGMRLARRHRLGRAERLREEAHPVFLEQPRVRTSGGGASAGVGTTPPASAKSAAARSNSVMPLPVAAGVVGESAHAVERARQVAGQVCEALKAGVEATFRKAMKRTQATDVLVGGTQVLAVTLTAPLGRAGTTAGVPPTPRSRSPMPGDELVSRPMLGYTRAITIDAPPDDVWPWLVQIGQGRGGLYSFDGLENLVGCDIHSADRILPDFQRLEVGDLIRLGPPGYPCFRVAHVEPAASLVLMGADPRPPHRAASIDDPAGVATWQWQLRPAS